MLNRTKMGSNLRFCLVSLLCAGLAVLFTDNRLEAQRKRKTRKHAKSVATQPLAKPATPSTSSASPPATPIEQPPTTPSVNDTPEPPKSDKPAPSRPTQPKLDALHQEFARLMSDMVALRSKVESVGRQLFKSKVRIKVVDEAQSTHRLRALALTLDGTPIYRVGTTGLGADSKTVFLGGIAPGPHEITLEYSEDAKQNSAYGYHASQGFRFHALKDKLTEVTFVIEDDSSIAKTFHDDREGEYDMRVRMRVAALDLNAK